MNTKMNKETLVLYLRSVLQEKIGWLKDRIASIKVARDSDTKSSAGDKHEVGREMAQQELETQEAQLAKTQKLLHSLSGIDMGGRNDRVSFGSLVFSSQGIYFIAIGLGQVDLDGKRIFCISLASPIGQLLNGQKVGAKVEFNGRNIEILDIK